LSVFSIHNFVEDPMTHAQYSSGTDLPHSTSVQHARFNTTPESSSLTNFPRRPHESDCHKIWFGNRFHKLNQLCRILFQSVHSGVWFSGGSNIAQKWGVAVCIVMQILLSAGGEVSGQRERFAVIDYDYIQKHLLFRMKASSYRENYICQLPQGLSVMRSHNSEVCFKQLLSFMSF